MQVVRHQRATDTSPRTRVAHPLRLLQRVGNDVAASNSLALPFVTSEHRSLILVSKFIHVFGAFSECIRTASYFQARMKKPIQF
jgi:hypothetical protein